MSYDSPKLCGLTFKNPPKPMDIRWKAIQQFHEMVDGSVKQRIVGYRMEATLEWDDGWIRSDDLTALYSHVIACGTSSYTFTPRPNSKSSLTYEVVWKNPIDFGFHEGRFDAYAGTIELVSVHPTATIGTGVFA